MAAFEYVDVNSDKHFDILVEVSFEKSLAPEDLTNILKIIGDILTDSVLIKELDLDILGVSNLSLDLQSLKVQFRFLSIDKDNKDDEAIHHQRVNFLIHLFAKINQQYKLGNSPFHEELFKHLLDIADYYGIGGESADSQ